MRQLGFIGTGNMGGALARAAALDAENALLLDSLAFRRPVSSK